MGRYREEVGHTLWSFFRKLQLVFAVVSALLRPEIQTIPPEHALVLVEAARRVSSVL